MMIVIGYSSYALIVIRSTANTPMDQNSPEDIFTLGEYLGREPVSYTHLDVYKRQVLYHSVPNWCW